MNRSRAARLPAALLIAVALLAAPALAGCSQLPGLGAGPAISGSPDDSQGGGQDGDPGDASGDEGSSDGSEIPGDFPEEVPLYDGQVVMANGIAVEDGGAWNVTIVVPDRDAYLDIEEQFAAAGYEHEEFLMSDAIASVNFTKGPFAAMVILSNDGEQWTASYQVTRS